MCNVAALVIFNEITLSLPGWGFERIRVSLRDAEMANRILDCFFWTALNLNFLKIMLSRASSDTEAVFRVTSVLPLKASRTFPLVSLLG